MPESLVRATTTDPSPSHAVEYEALRRLQSLPELKIASLVVRRIPEGICIQGVLESSHSHADLQTLLREITGVTEVVNHLVPCHSREESLA